MIPTRPLLYLSLPGVAFILGVIWLRRRNKVRCGDTGKDGKKSMDNKENLNDCPPVKPTQSLEINKKSNNEDGFGSAFGKSAPINIVQNGRTSPMTDKQIDTEILKVKIQDAENKMLRSIEEDFEIMSSPSDLPGSVNRIRVSFCSTSNSLSDKPVIVKATCNPKISPENSFLESKYTQNCEHKTDESPQTAEKPKSFGNKNTEIDLQRNVDIASPSLSLCSHHSEDSGKGSSLPHSEPARVTSTYEFLLPTSLIGALYGRKRAHINQIRDKTAAKISLKKHPIFEKFRICVIEGSEDGVASALSMIRSRLPVNRYPNLKMQKIQYIVPQTAVLLSSEHSLGLQLNLIEGINNDVIVSAILSAGHIFVQHPLHPSHPSLTVLQNCLYENYTKYEAPLVPEICESTICVANIANVWYRVQIVQKCIEDPETGLIKFLDYGGYASVHLNQLRQIKTDFMTIPFQATECLLHNIEPIDPSWTSESADVMLQLTKGIVLQAQVAGYNTDNIPEIFLYANLGVNNIIFINKELVGRKLASWVESQD